MMLSDPFVLSSSQMSKIAEKRSFPNRLMLHIEQVLREIGREINQLQLKMDIKEGIRHAAYYQLSTEFEVASYVETVCVVLGGFGELPHPREARQILYDHRQTPETKLERFRQWAKQAASPSAF